MRHATPTLTGCIAVLCLQACARAPGAPDAPAGRTCVLLPGEARGTGTVLVGLSAVVEPPVQAPPVSTASQALLFSTFYETLTRIDCEGRVVPGLAEGWRSVHGGLEWEFTLRADARFWDGSPVTAASVVACWRDRPQQQPVSVPWLDARARNGLRLVVSLASPRLDLPRELARSEHAVTKPADFSGWPVGTGSHRPGAPEEPDARGARTLTAYPARGGTETVLRFLMAKDATPQQLLDAGVDVLIADDAAGLVEPEFTALPLSWTTTYAVLCTTRSARDRLAAALPLDAREALARDVVRGSARAAEPPRWWSEVDACAAGFALASPYFERDERIVYMQQDGRARALAERLVAVGLAPSARGLEPEPFATVLSAGGSTAYVLALPSFAASPCGEAQALVRRAPWLVRGSPREREERRAAASPAAESPLGQALHTHTLALVETRGALWARRGLVGIVLTGDGTPRLEGIGWKKPAGSP